MAELPDYTSDVGRLAALIGYDVLDTEPEEGFDSIVELAAHISGCPVALVSLVDRDRQWFKARVNFPSCETDLNSSVCAHALLEPDLLVIPDLTADPRTRRNPLVTGDPHIRFYAGAPLRHADGHTLGSLCVIDKQPRPHGLTPPQKSALKALSAQVMTQLDLRQALRGQQQLIERSEALIRTQAAIGAAKGDLDAILQALVVGALEAVPHAEGGSIEMLEGEDLVYRAAAGTTAHEVGLRLPLRDSLAGQCLLSNKPLLCPDVARDRQIKPDLIERLNVRSCLLMPIYLGGDPVGVLKLQASKVEAFGRQDLQLAQVFTGTVTSGLAEAAFRRQAKATRQLLELGDRLRDTGTAQEAILISGEIAGRLLELDRAGYCDVDPDTQIATISEHWGGTSLAGSHMLRDYGSIIDDLRQGLPVVIEDVTTDPRTAAHAARFHQIGVSALINVALVENGRLVAIFFAHKAKPHAWTADERAQCINIADRTRAAVARLNAEASQAVLNEELSHRMKNTMAMVQAIAIQTLRDVTDKAAVAAFTDRVHALSTAHGILMQASWIAADMMPVVRGVLDRFRQLEQFDIAGPDIQLGPRAVLSLSMLLHELTANAIKYGALSLDGGRVTLHWRVEPATAGDELVVSWQERGGPAATKPSRRGFGSRLIQMGLIGSGGVELDYGALGFSSEMRALLTHLRQS